jgi:hypothetical protein
LCAAPVAPRRTCVVLAGESLAARDLDGMLLAQLACTKARAGAARRLPASEGDGVMPTAVARSCPCSKTLLVLLALGGCSGGDGSDVVVGSGEVVERVEQAMFVEHVEISLPFHAYVVNGEPNQVLLRGEDNLLDLIHVEETAMGVWQIEAPPEVMFEQHEDIAIEIPYLDMVLLSLDGDIELREPLLGSDTGS